MMLLTFVRAHEELFFLYVHEHDRLKQLSVIPALRLIPFVDLVPIATEKVSRIRSNIIWNRWKRVSNPGGYSIYPWVGRCGAAPHTLTLFKTNIADFPTLLKTEFRFFNTLFKTFNPNIN